MNNPKPVTFKGKRLGIVALIATQFLIGVIHVIFGFWLFSVEIFYPSVTLIYDVYTVIFGVLVLVFAVFIWRNKRIGWIGTIGVSIFVIVADSLTVVDLPSIPGIPKGAAFFEIAYSVIIVLYLSQGSIRRVLSG